MLREDSIFPSLISSLNLSKNSLHTALKTRLYVFPPKYLGDVSGGRNRYRKSGKNTHTQCLALKARAALPRPQRTSTRKMFDL